MGWVTGWADFLCCWGPQKLLDVPPTPVYKSPVGLFENLRVLRESDIGASVGKVQSELRTLRSEFDDFIDLMERRWRRLRKRAVDDPESEHANGAEQSTAPVVLRPSGNPRIDRLRARRVRHHGQTRIEA